MKQVRFRFTLSAAIMAIAVVAGCREKSSDVQRAATKLPAVKPSPEDSFKLIVETFRRGVEEVEIGFVLRDDSGHSMMTGKNKVSHELIPPANENERYRAIITVDSQSRYSIQRSTGDEEQADDEETGGEQTDVFAESGAEDSVEILEPDLVSVNGTETKDRRAPSDTKGKQTVARRPDKAERKYELIYENERWVLVTKLDPETEQSIRYAFDRALGTQI